MGTPELDFCSSGVTPDLRREGCNFLDNRRGDTLCKDLWCQVGDAKPPCPPVALPGRRENRSQGAELSPGPSSLTCGVLTPQHRGCAENCERKVERRQDGPVPGAS